MVKSNEKNLKLTLKKRLIIGFIVIPIIAMLSIFVVYGIKTKKIIVSNINNYSNEMLKLIDRNINLNFETFDKHLDEILMSPLIQEGLQNAKVMTYKEKRNYVDKFDEFLKSKLYLVSSVGEIEILTKDLSILYTQGFKYFNSDDLQKYSELANESMGTLWFHTNISGQGNVAMVRAIREPKTKMINGYIFVAINENTFAKSFLDLNLENGSTINIVDESGKYLFGQMDKDIASYGTIIDTKTPYVDIGTINYMQKSEVIDGVGWKVVNLIPSRVVENDIAKTMIGLIFFGVLLMCVIGTTTRYIYRKIYNPIARLILGVNIIIDGDLDLKLDIDGNDEISFISRQFNLLIDKIKKLLTQVRYEQNLKRESEIKMLQAQINPHFLFNTLNTLKWIATMNDDEPVSNGLSALAKLLRNTIVDSNEFVSINEELENIKNYIVIQKLRYGDSFDVNYLVYDDLYNKKIIKFLLQPVVENSILHGFDEEGENQIINIIVKREDDNICVIIKDNGKGFDVDKVGKTEGKLSGIGYKNVEERIRLTYGERYGCSVISNIGEGTEVKMILKGDF